MIGQSGIYKRGRVQPIRYEALRERLTHVRSFAHEHRADVQMPRIGCGLAGGDWEEVSKIIEEELSFQDVMVTVLDLPTPETPDDAA